MSHFKVFVRLAAIMTVVCIVSVGITTYFLYLDEMSQFRDRLVESVHRMRKSVESIALYNTDHIEDHIHAHGVGDRKEYVREQTIAQVRSMGRKQGILGDIEITIAYLEESNIKWAIQSHQDEVLYVPIPMGHEWAIPMQLALRGGSSVTRGIDYAGKEVLAAYTYIDYCGIGIVAKSPVRKIQTRFIKGAMIAVAPAFGVMVIGIIIFIRTTSPVIQKLEIENAIHKKTAEEREKIRKEYESLVRNVPGMIYTANEDWTVTIISGSELVSEYSEEDINARKERWLDIVHPDDREEVLSGSLKIGGEIEPVVQQDRVISKQGEVHWVEDRKVLISGEGIIGILFDITDRIETGEELKKLNEQQRQTSKMEAIGNFATGIAHDFNNALTPIIGNCDIILNDIGSRDSCQIHKKNILSVLAGAETASLLVHRIQSFVTSGTSIKGMRALRLPGCLQEAFGFLRSIIPTSIKMSIDVDSALYVVAATDVTIRQILMNICKNAAQAMRGDSGEILIKVSNDEVQVERYGVAKGKYVKIEVEDNGRGMSPEVLERALDPYFTTKKLGEGTGIGLSVVNGIVTGYGGFIRLYSEVGRGSRIVIYIPAVEDDGGLVDECLISEAILMGNKERILLVDDEDLIISSSTAILESLNYVVTGFNSSVAALDELQRNPDEYDVLLTDLTMPEMTGAILVKEAKKTKPSIKVVLCSGLGSNGKYAKGVQGQDIDAYITKPVTRRGYSEVLAKILKKE